MKYVKQSIDYSTVTTNIDEGIPSWSPTTPYILEPTNPTSASLARVDSDIYRSVTNDNLNFNPLDYAGTKWVFYSPSNAFAMLDQKSLTATSVTFTQDDADYLSNDTATDIPQDSLVWDVDNSIMYKSLVATNDLPNTDFSDTTLWQNKSYIIIEFNRNIIDTLGLGYLASDGILIEHLDSLGDVIDEVTQEIDFSVNENVFDLWDYIYSEYTNSVDRGLKIDLAPVGSKIRVTIKSRASLNTASCGFFIAGEGIEMGCTLDGVNFSYNSFSVSNLDDFGNLTITRRNVQDLVDFETIIDKEFTPRARRNIKSNYDEIMLFIVDESDDSDFENMITLGKIQDASLVGEVSEKNVISWSIMEAI